MRNFKVLIFSLSGEYFSTSIEPVERIIGYENPVIIPNAPSFVQGIIKYENTIIPVINMAKKFNIEDNYGANKKIIIIKSNKKKIGVIVENVHEVKGINENNMLRTPEIASDVNKVYIKGIIKEDERIIIHLDLEKILKTENEEKIF